MPENEDRAMNPSPPEKPAKTWKQWTLAITGALIVGAAGNAAWEVAIKPGFLFVGRVVFSVVTLGLSSFQDSLYSDAAKRPQESVASTVFVIMSFGFSVFAGYMFAEISIEMKEKASGSQPDEQNGSRRSRPTPVLFLWFLRCSMAFLSIWIIARQYSQATTLGIVSKFDQQMAIHAPEHSESERLVFASRFASMTKSSEFDALINDITRRSTPAAANAATMP